jgi:hypothetical protein
MATWRPSSQRAAEQRAASGNDKPGKRWHPNDTSAPLLLMVLQIIVNQYGGQKYRAFPEVAHFPAGAPATAAKCNSCCTAEQQGRGNQLANHPECRAIH